MAQFGIDISAWQKGLNIAQCKAEGVTFAIIKFGGADSSKKYKDSQAENFYAQCAENKIPVGAYYFGKCTTEAAAIEEAKHFLTLISGKTFPCKVWYDIEGTMGNLANETLNSIAKAFCKTVNAAGFDCGVYANASTFKKIDFDGSFSALYPKWVASWGKTKPSSVRYGRDMWQFGGETNLIHSNKIAGKTVDQDYCYFEIGAAPVNPTPVTPTPIKTEYSLDDFRKDVINILGVKTCKEAFEKTITISILINKFNALVTPLERYMKALGYYEGKIEVDEGKKPNFGGGMMGAIKKYQKDVVKAIPRFQDGILTKKGATWETLLLK